MNQLARPSASRAHLRPVHAAVGAIGLCDGIALLAIPSHPGAAVFALMMLSATLVALAQQTLP